MKRSTSLHLLVWVLGVMLIASVVAVSQVEWAVGDAFDLRIEQVVERVQLGFLFGGFRFDETAYIPRLGLEISACLQEFSPPRGLEAIESGWPVARMVLRRDQRISGVDIPIGDYLAIAWVSDCVFLLEGRWFRPRTAMVILVRESDLSGSLPDDGERWSVLIPSRVVLVRGSPEHLSPIRCDATLEPYVNRDDVIVDLCVWNMARLTLTDALPGPDAPLTVPAVDNLYPGTGDISLHEALFSP